MVCGGCHGNERASVVATNTQVIVAVEIFRAYRGDCDELLELDLAEALGERVIIDAHTGEPGCIMPSCAGVNFGSNC